MSASSPQTFWLPLLALVAAELGLIAALVAALQHWSSSAGWRRVFCQAGLLAVLLLSVGELSGAARFAVGRLMAPASRRPTGPLALETNPAQPNARSDTRVGKSTARSIPPLSLQQDSWLDLGPIHEAASPGAGTASPPLPLPTGRQEAGTKPSPPLATRRHEMAPGRNRHSEAPAGSPQPAGLPAGFWLVLVWTAGALVVGGRVCFAHCVCALSRLRRCEMADRALLERMERLARALGLRRRVRVMSSARLAGPIAFGWIWPSVALPADFAARLDRVKQDAVLLHELAHLAAHDPFWNLLADAATVVLWWHPAVWWLRRQLQLAGELAADEASLLVADGPRALAECLVQLGARLLQRPVGGQIPVTGFRSHLGRRVQQLLRLEGRTWSPPRRLSAALARSLGAAATALAVVLCTAWAAPRELTNGDSMKTIQQNWKQSLAAFAFLAAINGPDALGRQTQTPPTTPAPAASAPAMATANPAVQPDTQNLIRRFGLTNADPEDVQRILQDLFRRGDNIRADKPRVGNPLIQGAIKTQTPAPQRAPAVPASVPATANRIEAKLKSLVLDELKPMQNIPLLEMIKLLSQQSRERDPEGKGVNFLLDSKPPSSPAPGTRAVDPATGLPLLTVPAETVDVSTVGITIPLALHHITLWDMLDILLKASDRPIQYTIEEYGVLFSLEPQTRAAESKPRPPAPAPERLSVRTFKVDTNTVVAALAQTFHISVPIAQPEDAYSRSQAIERGLSALFDVLGLKLKRNSIFYNGLTGVVMVRASREDMEVISAAMETLTGLEQKRDPRQSETGSAERGNRSGMGTALNPSANPAPEAMKTMHPTVTETPPLLGERAGVRAAMKTKDSMIKETAAATNDATETTCLFRLAHADPNQMVDILHQLFPGTTRIEKQLLLLKAQREKVGGDLPPSHPMLLRLDEGIARLQNQAANNTPDKKLGQVIVVPDRRTHSIMVSAPPPLMPQIAEAIQKLDTEAATSGAPPETAPRP